MTRRFRVVYKNGKPRVYFGDVDVSNALISFSLVESSGKPRMITIEALCDAPELAEDGEL